jgi:DNA-binding transcriptional LysR family regulator
VVLAEAGKQLYDTLNRGDDEISALLEKLAEGHERPSGRLRVNAPMAFGERFLVRPIAEYAALYPDVVVDAEFTDKRVHLVEEGYDLVIRIGALEDSGLIAKRLCDCPGLVCASPAFVKKYGLPQTPEQLEGLPSVVYSGASSGPLLTYRDTAGRDGSLAMRPSVYSNSLGMMLAATLQGIGYARMPVFACAGLIQSGALIQLIPDYQITPEMGIYAIYPDKRFLPLKVRKFIEILDKRLPDTGSIKKPDGSAPA